MLILTVQDDRAEEPVGSILRIYLTYLKMKKYYWLLYLKQKNITLYRGDILKNLLALLIVMTTKMFKY